MHPFEGLLFKSTTHNRPGKQRFLFSFIFWVCLLFFPDHSSYGAEHPIPALHPYITHGGYSLQINGSVVRSFQSNNHFIPASTLKVLTGLMALEVLGPQYRFVTEIYLDDSNNLYIKGEGDPFLVSETVMKIAEQLKLRNIHEINTLYLDDSAFALEGPPAGSVNSNNPYDAQSGALAVNFNALPFRVMKNGTVESGEKQTPFLPIMADCTSQYSPGRFRINISSFPKARNCANILRYTGELFSTVFQNRGIRILNGFKTAKVPQNARIAASYQSDKTVADLVQISLKYSSNFIANQLFLSCGRRVYGFPATWAKAQQMAKVFIEVRLKLAAGQIHMVDGSGLSTENQLTPVAMLSILNRFKPHAALLKKKDDIYIKSGTLTGSYCYVGFFQDDQELAPFVLFLNQKRNTRKVVLNLMHKEFTSLLPLNHGT